MRRRELYVLADHVHGNSMRVPDVLLAFIQPKLLHCCLDVVCLHLVSITWAATVDAYFPEGERKIEIH